MFEPRRLLTVTPPISSATAAANLAAAQTALIAALNSLVNTDGNADQQYSTDTAQDETNYSNDVQTAENQFDSNVAGIESGLNTTLNGLESGLDTQLNADETAFESAIDGDVAAFDSAMAGPEATLTSDFANHDATFLAAIDTANVTMDSAINGTGGLGPSLDSFIQSQEATFESNVASENSTFTNYVNGPSGPVATYNSAETAAWTAYLSAVDTSPTGLEGIYDNNVASDVTTLNTALAPYASFNYDPSVLEGTPAYDSLLAAADAALNGSLNTAGTNYQNQLDADEQTFQNAISGPTGAQATYDALMVPVDHQLDVDGQNAEDTYEGSGQTAQATYDNAVNGPTGFQHTFDVNVAADEANYDSLVDAATTTRDGLIATAKTTYDGQVQTEEQTYQDWETVNNPYVLQMQNRTQTLINQLTTLIDNFNHNQIQPLQSALQSSVDAANTAYNNAANDAATGFITQLNNSISGDYQAASGVVQPEYTNYQNQLNGLFSSWMTSMMNAMMNGLPAPPPPTAAAESATQDYQLQVAAEDITLTDQLGGALVAYVGAERAADTFRDLSIVSAFDTDEQAAINDADSLEASEIADIVSWLDDMADIERNFEIDDESHYVTMMDDIGDDWKAFVQAADADEEAFEVTESNDYLAYEQQVDAEVENFRNSEMGARITMLDSDADAERDYEEAIALAEENWVIGEASAEYQYAVLADAAEEALANAEAADYTSYITAVAGDYQTWINTVSAGIATQYAAYYGGASDATAVANAWATYDQSVAADWDSLIVGEANDFQAYVNQEEAALDAAEDDVAAHNETREDNIAADFDNEVNAVAPAIDAFDHSVDGLMGTWMTTVAGAEKSANDDNAASENTYELALAPQIQSLYDHEAADVDSTLHTEEADASAEFTTVVNDEDAAAHQEDAQWNTEMNTVRQKSTTLETNVLAAWDTKETTELPAEDGLMVAYATYLKAQGDLAAANHFDSIAAQPLSSFDSQFGQQASLMPFTMAFPATDNTYIGWASGIAAAATPATSSTSSPSPGPSSFGPPTSPPGPPAPPSSPVNPQTVTSDVRESVKPQVTVGAVGQIVSTNLGWGDWFKLKFTQIAHPSYSGREAAVAAGFTVLKTGQSLPSVPRVAPPTTLQSFTPVQGPLLNARYHLQEGNIGTFVFYEGMAISDMFMVSAAANGLAKATVNGISSVVGSIGTLNLPYRTAVTPWVQFTRFFATRTGYQQVVRSSPIVTWLQRHGWEAHHWFIPNSAARAGSEGLRRIGQAGWNLIPLPAAWNRAISNGGAGYNATRALIGLSPVLSGGLGYGIGTGIYNIGAGIIGDDE